jgi:hypothetical protein
MTILTQTPRSIIGIAIIRQKLLQTHTRSVTGNSEVDIKKEEPIKEHDSKEAKKESEKIAIFDAINSPCISTLYELEKMTM